MSPTPSSNPISPLPAIIGTQKPFPWFIFIFTALFLLTLVSGFFFFLQAQSVQGLLRLSPTP